jgi:hypothetical protein
MLKNRIRNVGIALVFQKARFLMLSMDSRFRGNDG